MPFAQALLSAASVGIGCGAGCGSAASAFLTTYVISEGKNMAASVRQVASFYLGKLLAVLLVCAGGSLLGEAFISAESALGGFPLRKLLYVMMLGASVWLLYGWFRERKGCKACRHCGASRRLIPTFAVGLAYGLSPCAPLMMVLGYSAMLPLPSALLLGAVFSLASSLVPSVLTMVLSGALSARVAEQLGKALPWFQLLVYLLYFISAFCGLFG
ncbi:MAG: hypothetical protein J5998_12685 [Clostridia bacterium]|nr:hypothetical protein [Clostridia bacterium]